MPKKICVIGTGYVGLLTAVGLSDFGNSVIGVDIDKSKIDSLNSGKNIIYEPGLDEYLVKNLESKRLSFTLDLEYAVKNSEVIFIAVGTPSSDNGDADLKYVYDALDGFSKYINSYKILVIKSTVPVGTNRIISKKLKENGITNVTVVSNPEFLREGKAVYDFFHPDRVVIGHETEEAKNIMEDVYKALNRTSVPFVWCNWESAEIIKYASNGFLALKIAFINQIACLAEETGADVNVIAKAMGMDGRIGSKFLHPGPGYGGSCFPKDTRALSCISKRLNSPISLIDCVVEANEAQKRRIFERLKKRIGSVKNKTIGILGLAFKAETDDVRESSAIIIVELLLQDGAIIQVHDPQAMNNFRNIFPNIEYKSIAYDVADNADALIILTEWNEYRSLDLNIIKQKMTRPYIFDTRNVIDEDELLESHFSYDLIGRKTE